MPGIPQDPGSNPRGGFSPIGVVKHETFGGWNGDYSVGVGNADDVIGFHFLIGKNEGQWVQFYSIFTKCNHAAGGNSYYVGIEVTGSNDEMTDWQRRASKAVCSFIMDEGSMPGVHATGGRQGAFNGFINHLQVLGSDHDDYWHEDDANYATSGGAVTVSDDGDDELTEDQAAKLEAIFNRTENMERFYNDLASGVFVDLRGYLDTGPADKITATDNRTHNLEEITSTFFAPLGKKLSEKLLSKAQ